MKPEYEVWIRKHFPTRAAAVGMCMSAARRMVEVFPELRVARGWFAGGEHAWCVTQDGEIIDPTRLQFTHDGEYREWQPGDEVRIGRCMNCGMDIYAAVTSLDGPRKSICSDDCAHAFASSLDGG